MFISFSHSITHSIYQSVKSLTHSLTDFAEVLDDRHRAVYISAQTNKRTHNQHQPPPSVSHTFVTTTYVRKRFLIASRLSSTRPLVLPRRKMRSSIVCTHTTQHITFRLITRPNKQYPVMHAHACHLSRAHTAPTNRLLALQEQTERHFHHAGHGPATQCRVNAAWDAMLDC